MSCRCAKFDNGSFRYKCSVSGNGCMFMMPDEKLCYEIYGEGPLKENDKKYNSYMQATEVDKNLCLTIAMEECSELIQAISKGKRGKLDKANLAEEIADVRICMSWLMNIFNIEFVEVNKWIDFKEDRITKRLNKGEFK